MEADSPVGMVPMIRNILGGFLFSGDDIYKKAGVLSGGERTRLAVARMLLRPANTLLLDEPTNHLDLDSKDVLLEALEDFGGTLIFVSHDRYFVDRLATKIIAVGHGGIEVYPGHLRAVPLEPHAARQPAAARRAAPPAPATRCGRSRRPNAARTAKPPGTPRPQPEPGRRPPPPDLRGEEAADAEARRQREAADEREPPDRGPRGADRRAGTGDQGARSPDGGPGFYDDRELPPKRSSAEHQALMWEVGDLMNQWEALQAAESAD